MVSSNIVGRSLFVDLVSSTELTFTAKQYVSCLTAVDPYWYALLPYGRLATHPGRRLAETGAVFFSVRSQDLSSLCFRTLCIASDSFLAQDQTKSSANRDFSRQAELEMEMSRDRERAAQDKIERAQALKSVASTPRIAGLSSGGITPRTNRTPRRLGL